MERADLAGVASFFSPEPFEIGRPLTLGEDAAHHARVRRLTVGERVRVFDGMGQLGGGRLVRVARSHAVVDVDEMLALDPLPALHLLVPVADRERMLWLAEKGTELALTSWRPVIWHRSKSVSPRGEGTGFQTRVRARMVAALAQSGGAWLPTLFPDATMERAIAATPAQGSRILLDPAAPSLLSLRIEAPATLALGPEGGFEPDEVDMLRAAGFVGGSIAGNTLRFETAGTAALALCRAVLAAPSLDTDG